MKSLTPLRSLLRTLPANTGIRRYLLAIPISISILGAPGLASADTIVRLGTEYPDRAVTEGYSGTLESLHNDIDTRRSARAKEPGGDTLRHSFHEEDVIISDVRASVYADDDRDGFFTHFTLNFDVDSAYGYEYVYARIYLRGDGEDYQLFHVTEVFEIYSDLASDRYRVDSALLSSFQAAYYDVRIEILIAGRQGVQDSVDASTHRTLHALPLEADQLDGSGGSDVIVHEHAGSATVPILLILAVFAAWRRTCGRHCYHK